MISELKISLRNHNFLLNFGDLNNNEPEFKKRLLFVRHFVTQVEKLYMTACYYSSSSFMEKIVQTLSNSNVKVCFAANTILVHSTLSFNNVMKMFCIINFNFY